MLFTFTFAVSLSLITLSVPTYWSVSDWSFYSGTGATSGPILFTDSISFTQWNISDGLVQFTDFSMGSLWPELGFSNDSPASNVTVTLVTASTIKLTVEASTGAVSTIKVDVGPKGPPALVQNVRNWNYSEATGVVTVQAVHSSPVNVILDWGHIESPSGTGGSGMIPLGPTTIVDPLTPSVMPSWLQKYKGLFVIGALYVIGATILSREEKPSPQNVKKKLNVSSKGRSKSSEIKKRKRRKW